MYKVLLAHPGTQHSIRVANALSSNNLLYKFATTVYDRPDSKWIRILKYFVNKDNIERISKRRSNILKDNDIITFCELEGLLSIAINRLDSRGIFYHKLSRFISKRFQKKLAAYIFKNRDDIDIVISYDMHSDILFNLLRKNTPEIIRVIDNAHPSRYFLPTIYEKIDSGDFQMTYMKEGGGFFHNKKLANRFREELLTANYNIVASTFSKKAALFSGVNEENIFLCPYGVSQSKMSANKNLSENLNLLFVGQINQRKGIYQLLEAAKFVNSPNIKFNIVGLRNKSHQHLYVPYEKYVSIWGYVTYEKLVELYNYSNIFIFPVLGEGYGLVILEALSAGLPVITTANCAGPDIIKNGYNGFVIEAGNTEELIQTILWFKNHPEKVLEMSINAKESVKEMTWDNYNNRLISILNEIYNKKKIQI